MSITDATPQQYPEDPTPVRAVHMGDDTVIRLDDALALVSSKSQVDVWHVVEAGRCTCAGFRYREGCRHVPLVAALAAAERVAGQQALARITLADD